ncbi:MAG: glycosyltransferase family 4 protein, partial [Chloroflexi bacterium]|nr:glycosyltransferase family 4 protein [Chloroflexota bacterium]
MTPTPIIYIHSSDELYGSDVVLLNLVSRLDSRRFRPLVLTPTDIAYEGLLSRELEAAGIEHHAVDLPVLRRRYLSPARLPALLGRVIAAPRRVRPFLASATPTLLHSNTTAVMAGALVRRQVHLPHLWHVHEIITQPSWLRKWIAFMVARSSDRVVAISQAVASHLLADQPSLAPRLSVIYDAVDTEVYHPDNDGHALREMWTTSSDQVLVGVIGRISAWKGQELFLRALAEAISQAPQLRGVIVGGPVPGEAWRLQALQSLAQELGIASHLIWAGYRRDMP